MSDTPESTPRRENEDPQQDPTTSSPAAASDASSAPDNAPRPDAQPAAATPLEPQQPTSTAPQSPTAGNPQQANTATEPQQPTAQQPTVSHPTAQQPTTAQPTASTVPQASAPGTAPAHPHSATAAGYSATPTAPQYGAPHISGGHPTPQAPTAPHGAPQTSYASDPAAPGSAFGPAAANGGDGTTTKKKRAGVPLIAALAVGALVGGVSGAGVTAWSLSANSGSPAGAESRPTTVTVNNAEDATAITGAVATAAPSAVTVYVTGEQGSGSGSGVIIDDDGHIVTNSHVVTLDGAAANPKIRVQTYDGRLLDATVVGTDPIADLAVIKVDDTSDLQPAEWGDSSDLNVGDTTIALGAPLGLSNSVSSGIVSALNRSIQVASSALPETQAPEDDQQQQDDGNDPFDFFDFDIPGQEPNPNAQSSAISLSVIQTDAAINHGNSGGPLVNTDGQVIGINVAIASAGGGASGDSGNIGVGFAIPSDVAQRVAKEIIENGTATHGLLGASVRDVTSDPEQTEATTVGASIASVEPGGAADAAGLKAGDIVTKFNDVPITGSSDLTAQVRTQPAGGKATITYVRDGRSDTVEVTLGQLQ
ncbi:putative serine protease PepD [Diaminobutyricimonas aerilata]|uniref:Putative serine protease PepD n=1 Tax=Diaminobutyricimonas aerilata TaxID=1162967 RepID=A0A2M9CI96_9MICO|nr:trypsin-like peptidase domain-containing protein [Diaminobutyricimonas aerilata]PJJ71646.1 putative serine protease PepD [Diaminobutyricimonas aerilata]